MLKWLEISADYTCNNRCVGCFSVTGDGPRMATPEVIENLRIGRAEGAEWLWIGGGEPTLRRDLFSIASAARKLGYTRVKIQTNGMMLAYPAGDEALAAFDELRRLTGAEGRDPASIGIEVWVSTAVGGPKDWREEFLFWKRAGVTHVTVASTHGRGIHVRIPGRTMADHLKAITDYRDAIGDLL